MPSLERALALCNLRSGGGGIPLNITQMIGVTISTCTILAYLMLFVVSRRWRRDLGNPEGSYWEGPKEERVKELMKDVWNPKRVVTIHGLSYFAEGYIRTAMSLWIPIFLLQVRKVSMLETALFVGLMNLGWSWKAFLGIVTDALPVRWRGRDYRRLPWFLASGILTPVAAIPFFFYAPEQMPIWTGLFPLVTIMLGADALLDLATDAYALDVTPSEYHSRILGGVGFGARSIGGVLACLLPPLFIRMGAVHLLFLSTGLVGMLAIPCCFLLKEPKLVRERIFSKRAIAFTFSEKSVYIASIVAFGFALSPRAFSSPIGGMFSLFAEKVLGGSLEIFSGISLAGVLMGIPGALIGGWASDKWGHRRMHTISLSVFALIGFFWVTLGMNSLWWLILIVITNFILNFYRAALYGLMSDITPLGLSSTVLQMIFSFIWIGGFVAAPLMGILLPVSPLLCVTVFSSLSLIGLLSGIRVKPYEAGKATKV